VKVYGCEYGYRYLIEDAPSRELGEVSFQPSDAAELRSIAAFIVRAADLLEDPDFDFDHMHYQDSDDWQEGDVDFIVYSTAPADEGAVRDTLLDSLSPFMRAAVTGDITAVRALLAAGASPDESDKDGWSALDAAASRGHSDVVAELLRSGAVVDVLCNGMTPLVCAAGTNAETVRLLLEAGANPNGADNDTRVMETPLYYAADKPEITALLIAAGANVHCSDEDGFTPLMAAAEDGCEAVVRLLLAAGVDPSIVCEGETASDLARAAGHDALADLLAEGSSPPSA
jgi:ankyrin repeat protein